MDIVDEWYTCYREQGYSVADATRMANMKVEKPSARKAPEYAGFWCANCSRVPMNTQGTTCENCKRLVELLRESDE